MKMLLYDMTLTVLWWLLSRQHPWTLWSFSRHHNAWVMTHTQSLIHYYRCGLTLNPKPTQHFSQMFHFRRKIHACYSLEKTCVWFKKKKKSSTWSLAAHFIGQDDKMTDWFHVTLKPHYDISCASAMCPVLSYLSRGFPTWRTYWESQRFATWHD